MSPLRSFTKKIFFRLQEFTTITGIKSLTANSAHDGEFTVLAAALQGREGVVTQREGVVTQRKGTITQTLGGQY